MTSNSSEYQREYQRQYRKTHPQKQYKKKKVKLEVKKVKNKMLEIALERLKPPRAPKMVEKRDSLKVGLQDVGKHPIDKTGFVGSNPTHASKTIDFSYLTNNSSFQRAIMEFIRKFVPGLEDIKVRGNKEVMKQSFNQNANNYRNVMKELKQVLEKRKK